MDPQAQLDTFLDKFTPRVAAEARSALARMKALVPGAAILVYDNYNALAIGFAPGEKAGEAVLSLAVFPKWVTLCFLRGAGLPDPHGLLKGSGSRVRHIRLAPPETIDDPRVLALVAEAVARAEPAIDRSAPPRLVIKSISAKQRPRRPAV
jgi:hypothetical protein